MIFLLTNDLKTFKEFLKEIEEPQKDYIIEFIELLNKNRNIKEEIQKKFFFNEIIDMKDLKYVI